MKRLFPLLVATAAAVVTITPADATLTTIGTADYGSGTYNLIHDNDLGLIWLDYSNAGDTWQNQMNWAASLNDAGVLTYNIDSAYALTWGSEGWRLPRVIDTGAPGCDWGYSGTDCGYNVDTSTGEMAHLYYDELGNLAPYDTNGNAQSGSGLLNTGPFVNLGAARYWYGTKSAADANDAWGFAFNGYQFAVPDHGGWRGLAVRSGEVTAASVPEPGTMILMGPGLAGLAFWRRFKKV